MRNYVTHYYRWHKIKSESHFTFPNIQNYQKRPRCWEGCQEEKGTTEDKMDGWHHQLNGHEFEQTPGDSGGQRSLGYCSPWGNKELDMT